jgi:starvation-inducible outer membrane lipoprotein
MRKAATRSDPYHTPQVDVDRAKRWPIGHPVTVTNDGGESRATTTRSAPWQQPGWRWVVLVEGSVGPVPLSRVTERG